MSGRRSTSGQHRKVEEARRIAREALGDAAHVDQPAGSKYVPVTKPAEPVQHQSQVVPVLLLREAATRLGISTSELERMIAAGKVKTLMAGWTVVVPASEVERLRRQQD